MEEFKMNSKKNFYAEGTFRNCSIPNSAFLDKWFRGNRLKIFAVLNNLCFIKGLNQTSVTASYICRCIGLEPSESNKKNVNTIIRDLAKKGYITTEVIQGGLQKHRITHMNQDVDEIYFEELKPIEKSKKEKDSDSSPMPWDDNYQD